MSYLPAHRRPVLDAAAGEQPKPAKVAASPKPAKTSKATKKAAAQG